MLGARRGIAVDLESIEDESRAVRALAQCAEYVLIDTESVFGSHSITSGIVRASTLVTSAYTA